jgi:hypothetical protein
MWITRGKNLDRACFLLFYFLSPIRYDVKKKPDFPIQKFNVGGISTSGRKMARDGVRINRQAPDVPDVARCLQGLPLRVLNSRDI